MKKLTSKIVLIWSILWLVNCVPRRRKNETIQKFHRTGEAIVDDDLLLKYEKEHQEFYKGEIRDGKHLEWPGLVNKNLSEYCRKYLQQSVPGRNTGGATGIKFVKKLHYNFVNESTNTEVFIVQCKDINKSQNVVYYMTRAPQSNCVYSLKSGGNGRHFILTIINKYCDFENKPLINKSLKRKRVQIVSKIINKTGQPIAKDEYVQEYEMEHRELLEREGNEDKLIEWPYAMEHHSLDSYCYQYMRESVPCRKRDGVKGSLKYGKLNYQKLNANETVKIIIVICHLNDASKLHYYFTRALETNCVFALHRQGPGTNCPLSIIFKHCDFEEPNDQQIISQDYNVPGNNLIIKTEQKGESCNTMETLQLFLKN